TVGSCVGSCVVLNNLDRSACSPRLLPADLPGVLGEGFFGDFAEDIVVAAIAITIKDKIRNAAKRPRLFVTGNLRAIVELEFVRGTFFIGGYFLLRHSPVLV